MYHPHPTSSLRLGQILPRNVVMTRFDYKLYLRLLLFSDALCSSCVASGCFHCYFIFQLRSSSDAEAVNSANDCRTNKTHYSPIGNHSAAGTWKCSFGAISEAPPECERCYSLPSGSVIVVLGFKSSQRTTLLLISRLKAFKCTILNC